VTSPHLSTELAVVDRPDPLVPPSPARRASLLIDDMERCFVAESDTGLRFRPDTPLDVWGRLTERLIHARERIDFALADAINFGANNPVYGEKYAQWVHATGRSNAALRRLAYVGRQLAPDRRRDDLEYSIQAEVVALPPKMGDSILELAAEHGWTQKQVRDAARTAKAQIKAAERALRPVPELVLPSCRIEVGDARALEIDDDSVDLIVTSPPYALDKDYPDGDVALAEWRAFLAEVCRELYRVSRDGGRLCLNVPLDTRRGGVRPTYAQAMFALLRAGWSYYTTIVWHDDQLGKSTARGSVDSATAPYLYAPVETIIVAYKGEQWGRAEPEGAKSDISHEDWLEWTNALWAFPGESRPWEEHPAAFPIELPKRLIHLLSFPGDLVCDPFVGSGTTAEAAIRAGRRFHGVDIADGLVASARRRLVEKGFA
jgi:site-specific DNA-methyltransferase (adenine-specific)